MMLIVQRTDLISTNFFNYQLSQYLSILALAGLQTRNYHYSYFHTFSFIIHTYFIRFFFIAANLFPSLKCTIYLIVSF